MLDLQVGEPSCSVFPIIVPFFVFNEFTYQEGCLNTLAIGNPLFVTLSQKPASMCTYTGQFAWRAFLHCIPVWYITSTVHQQ